ncbi:hypothetical protein PCASD_11758 [Puccinia coronata f. sp. avenae]|uniref:DNA 3'-5' helicase n=1 Tax=Puccinia coronata f. sp. avenae TaxID=200324 RepID=A0A2N5UQL9_9BASI|nr:hypothetical protein PCASD_11758 [Puccinia coronata f. sp. avenae]
MARSTARDEWRASGIRLLKKMLERPNLSLSAAIANKAIKQYGQVAKPLQLKTVVNLARGCNVILLAGTRFGKSQISELYHNLTPKESKAVVVVLNPLDALGDNQVLEKKQAGFTAINLTKLKFNPMEARKITRGEYNFVYVSPEIFLNSQLFTQLYFLPKFQNRPSLVVVDEAHLIYQWGRVKSKRGRANKKKPLLTNV